ncbi:tetratricopeptide repeat protein, partial [Hyalangium minutum]|uniref:tetratricopeptide repeat protein n=1 Tax=Hyalangium minutum TaxID=394096 RepID=UPI001F0B6F71
MKRRWAHVVILTAIPLEYQAAKQVEAGAWEGSHWEEERGPNGLRVAFRTFRGQGGRPLRVALAQAEDMGSEAATNALLPLVEAYQPRCVAMCGVCAGRSGKTNLGDVVAAERLFFHDTGKRLPDRVEQDLKTYNLRGDWKQAIEHLDFSSRFRDEAWWKKRPIPYAWQENWVLAQLHQGVADPSALPECDVYCPQWEKVIEDLWKTGCVEHGTLSLTDSGRTRIQALLIKHRQRFPDLSPEGAVLPFKVHVAPMGSGSQVVEDEKIWTFISESMRKTLGLEMEAAALGAVAHTQRDKKLDAVVMKGVMDFANSGRDDHFKEFAARASAECLIAFLRDHLDVDRIPGVDDLLVSGTGTLPQNPPPSTLLQARYQVVPFREQGRESILQELDRWCGEGPPVSVRLIHAEGGVGKTRLAIEWLGPRSHRWAAGFLANGVSEDWFEKLCALGQPVVVVVDYAESHPHLRTALLQVLRYAQQESSSSLRRIRLLLLARNAGDWWQALCQSDAALGAWLNTVPPYELAPLAPQKVEREQVFREAAEWFAKAQRKAYTPRPIPPLADEHFERVLYLHMAALAAVEGLEFKANTLMEVVLDHEERFWEAQAQLNDVAHAFWRTKARQIVAAATLRGGFAEVDATEQAAGRIFGHPLTDHEQELPRLLHRVYERKDSDHPVFLPPLEPDLLGEGMVLRAASRQGEERLPPDWIHRVFPVEEGTAAVGHGFEVLGRASATKPEVARLWIEQLLAHSLQERARLAFESAKAVGLHTAFSVLGDVLAEQLEAHGDSSLAVELEAAGIPHPTVSLLRVAEWIERSRLKGLGVTEEEGVLVEQARLQNTWGTRLAVSLRSAAKWIARTFLKKPGVLEKEGELAERARLQNNLGVRLSELGRREEALVATQEAVVLRRALAQRNPDAFQPDLAMSLNNLGVSLSELGRREEALAATQEAVELYRALAQRNPDAFQPDLAGCFNNLGAMLSELGRREEALAATQEAVVLRRALAQRNPDAFQPDLAGCLNNLGAMLSGLGRREEALAATQEAVEFYRALAQRNPDAFQPDLAGCLNNLGNRLSELGRREEALAATQEAVEFYRALAQRNPDAFQPALAMSLNNLGAMLSELGRREEALAATQEAVVLRRALAQRNPDAFQPDLAMSLNNLGTRLSELGRREEALAATQEAVEFYRALAQRNPDAFQPA